MDIYSITNFLQSLIVFLLGLSLLVLVHEFGHFIAARRAGIKVEEFGLGFPPKIWSKRRGETLYSLNAIPIGGFVKLYGEDDSVSKDIERAFFHKGKLVRTSVVVAGVIMNFFLAVFIFSIISYFSGIAISSGQIKVTAVATNSPAENSGVKIGDIVISVDGENVSQDVAFIQKIDERRGKETIFTLSREGNPNFNIKVTPREDPPKGEGALGVAFLDKKIIYPPFFERVVISLKNGFDEAVFWISLTITGVSHAITQAFQGQKPEGLAGPIGIFQITGFAAQQGIFSLLGFIGILSVNLAVLNIMPFPALDGGRLLFIIVETLFGRKVLPKFEKYAHAVGMVILLILMLLITFSDIQRFLSGQSILPQ